MLVIYFILLANTFRFLIVHLSDFSNIRPLFLQRLQSKVLKLVDISYGGENGFNQAIELSTEVLSNVKFIQEKKLIGMKKYTSIYSLLHAT